MRIDEQALKGRFIQHIQGYETGAETYPYICQEASTLFSIDHSDATYCLEVSFDSFYQYPVFRLSKDITRSLLRRFSPFP